jgi:glucose-specific phosphotransferase system IIA component
MFSFIKKFFSTEPIAKPETTTAPAQTTASTVNEWVVLSPLTGELKALSEVPDPVFAQEMMGKGVAIYPTSNVVVAPFDGTVTTITKTKHAIGVTSNNGIEILIHIGIDTVKLNGEGFEMKVEEGDKIKLGQELIKLDLEFLKANAPTILTPVICTNTANFADVIPATPAEVTAASSVVLNIKK